MLERRPLPSSRARNYRPGIIKNIIMIIYIYNEYDGLIAFMISIMRDGEALALVDGVHRVNHGSNIPVKLSNTGQNSGHRWINAGQSGSIQVKDG